MDRGYWVLAACALALLVVGGGAYVTLGGQNAQDDRASLDVRPVDGNVSANDTVAFDALSPGQQAVFQRARNTTGGVDVPSDVSEGVFADYRYVRYQNRSYETIVAVA